MKDGLKGIVQVKRSAIYPPPNQFRIFTHYIYSCNRQHGGDCYQDCQLADASHQSDGSQVLAFRCKSNSFSSVARKNKVRTGHFACSRSVHAKWLRNHGQLVTMQRIRCARRVVALPAPGGLIISHTSVEQNSKMCEKLGLLSWRRHIPNHQPQSGVYPGIHFVEKKSGMKWCRATSTTCVLDE